MHLAEDVSDALRIGGEGAGASAAVRRDEGTARIDTDATAGGCRGPVGSSLLKPPDSALAGRSKREGRIEWKVPEHPTSPDM